MAEKKLIDLYPYSLQNGHPEFLLLKRSAGKVYQNQWRMIGGKVKETETYWQAALRELKEETGYSPDTFWTIPSVNQFYEHSSDKILSIPAFAAEVNSSTSPVLDDEHSGYAWIKAEDVDHYIQWPEQRRLIRLTNELLISNQILEAWLVPYQS